eukprot:GHVT01088696.1.p2 GENE.GHVT01088696.1~~GHVT01088696.1.p2  ORF type:complete len:115 (-),score=13.54 GHVT01088696.1:233-577(-)
MPTPQETPMGLKPMGRGTKLGPGSDHRRASVENTLNSNLVGCLPIFFFLSYYIHALPLFFCLALLYFKVIASRPFPNRPSSSPRPARQLLGICCARRPASCRLSPSFSPGGCVD